jgi:hypothetical protein
MAVTDAATVWNRSEETPLLRDGSREGIDDDGSEETLAENGDEEELLNSDRANQHVGKGRGFLIILSVWALIFLQGGSTSLFSEIQYVLFKGLG